MNKGYGCLSGTAMLSAFITILVIVASVIFYGGTIFSAGALNSVSGSEALGEVASHHDIGGECKACHTAPWESDSMSDHCLVCHTKVNTELLTSDGLHGRILEVKNSAQVFRFPFKTSASLLSLQASSSPLKCIECHPEHRGESAPLVDMTHVDFPHEGLEFSLKAHQEKSDGEAFACADCHAGEYDVFNTTKCVDCHYIMEPQETQVHALEFGTDCLDCHDGIDTFGSNFDHNLFPFQLTGLHAQAGCSDCHLGARSLAGLKSTPQDCFSCHQKDDHHAGQLGIDCAACHSPEGWDQVKVDHSRFAFALTGAHAVAACESCHQNSVFKGTPQACNSCHQKDEPHEGRFGEDCASCHSTDAWKPAKFDHNLADFKLDGAHVNAACESCHTTGAYRGTPKDCFSCHSGDDKHLGQFGKECSACHNTSTWEGAVFDHNTAAFRLTGAHVNAPCTSCHVNGVFKGTPQNCYACHSGDDQHNGQYGTSCDGCHSTDSWKGATFNHSLSRFPLTGRHANLACERCHAGGKFAGTPSACVSCHADPAYHAGIFGSNCASCHNTSNWSASYNGSHPGIADEGGFGVNHGHTTCRTCHVSTLHSATCTACHDGNGGEDDGGGDGGGDDD